MPFIKSASTQKKSHILCLNNISRNNQIIEKSFLRFNHHRSCVVFRRSIFLSFFIASSGLPIRYRISYLPDGDENPAGSRSRGSSSFYNNHLYRHEKPFFVHTRNGLIYKISRKFKTFFLLYYIYGVELHKRGMRCFIYTCPTNIFS
jgi:hypothetical protein